MSIEQERQELRRIAEGTKEEQRKAAQDKVSRVEPFRWIPGQVRFSGQVVRRETET